MNPYLSLPGTILNDERSHDCYMEETAETNQIGLVLTESQAEQCLKRINDASGCGVATTWRTSLDQLLNTKSTYEPVEILRILDGLRKKNLVERYTAYRKLVADPRDHEVFAWGEVCFAAHASDFGRAIELVKEYTEIFPDRYDLASIKIYLLTMMKADSGRCVEASNAMLKRFSKKPGAWLTAEYFSRHWKANDYNQRLRTYILKYFPDSNVQRAIMRDIAFESGDVAAAIEYARTVVAHDPGSGFAWYALAKMQFHQGDFKNAKLSCDHAIVIQPFNRTFLELGRTIEANLA